MVMQIKISFLPESVSNRLENGMANLQFTCIG